jgi:hypothetical protein
MHEALGLNPSTARKQKERKKERKKILFRLFRFQTGKGESPCYKMEQKRCCFKDSQRGISETQGYHRH